MAIAGAGGWIPSTWVSIQNRNLAVQGIRQNAPKAQVCQDMALAAALLREKPGEPLRVHCYGHNINRLRGFLEQSGDVDA